MNLPDFVAAPACVEFHRGLFEEHLEKAGFLYEQRQVQMREGLLEWPSIAALEHRLHGHVDALTLGKESAELACVELMGEFGAGSVFAALSVFCRNRNARLTSAALRCLDDEDPGTIRAVRDALCFELPDDWGRFVDQAIARSGKPARLGVLASVAAFKNLPVGTQLLAAVQSSAAATPEMLDALGRLQVSSAQPLLRTFLVHPDASLRSAALLSLCQLRDYESLHDASALGATEAWPRLAMGVAGGPHAVQILLRVAESSSADRDCLLALGALGDPVALPALCACLQREAIAADAAQALQWITGAQLYEESFIPENVDEASLTDDELQAWRQNGKPPTRPDGRAFGDTVIKVSCDAQVWRQWLATATGVLTPGLRYRSGKPCEPGALVDVLADRRSDRVERHMAALELAMRYRCPVHFDGDMLVEQQWASLGAMRAWAEGLATRSAIRAGGWNLGSFEA